MKEICLILAATLALVVKTTAFAQSTNDQTSATGAKLKDELLYQRATESYLWALPLLNMWAKKEGSEAKFGAGYNVLPIWKERMNAKTLVTTPNSDVIYAMGYLDLHRDEPMVIEAPPGLQGILDDFFQRPIRMVGQFEGRDWSGDVGLPGPDTGQRGKYLVLPPD
jgi:hypothetical protein